VSECVDYFSLAGATVAVRWPSPAVQAELGAALQHRRIASGAAALSLRVRAQRPPPAAGEPAGMVVSDQDALFSVTDTLANVGQGIDLERASGWMAFDGRQPLPLAEQAAPFRYVFHRWLGARGTHILHGGAVGLAERGAVLLAAPSGGGKSNTLLACLSSRLQLLGEDYVAVDDAAEPRVWSLYSSAKFYPGDLARYPGLDPGPGLVRDPREPKVMLQLGSVPAARFADGLPLRAILVLGVVPGEASRVMPAAPGEAVKALLTNPLMVLPAARRRLFEFITGLAGRLPVYRLELGRDPAQIAGVVDRFLSR
jgi:hypothetical protein